MKCFYKQFTATMNALYDALSLSPKIHDIKFVVAATVVLEEVYVYYM